MAALDEMAGGDKSVTTVVAGAGHDHDARQLQPGGRFGHGPPGVFHELMPGVPAAIVSRSASDISAVVSNSSIASNLTAALRQTIRSHLARGNRCWRLVKI